MIRIQAVRESRCSMSLCLHARPVNRVVANVLILLRYMLDVW